MLKYCLFSLFIVSFHCLLRSLLFPVLSCHSGWVSIMVHWPLEPLYYSIPARRGQGWHQSEKPQASFPENCLHLLQEILLALLSRGMLHSNFTNLICCNSLGPWPESSVGGPSGLGEGHLALAICTAGPGEVVPPTSPKHRLQQPWSALRGETSQGDSTQFYGIWSTGERKHKPFWSYFVSIISIVYDEIN